MGMDGDGGWGMVMGGECYAITMCPWFAVGSVYYGTVRYGTVRYGILTMQQVGSDS